VIKASLPTSGLVSSYVSPTLAKGKRERERNSESATWILNPARDLDSVYFLSPSLKGKSFNPFPSSELTARLFPAAPQVLLREILSAHLETRELNVFLVFRVGGSRTSDVSGKRERKREKGGVIKIHDRPQSRIVYLRLYYDYFRYYRRNICAGIFVRVTRIA